MSKTGIDIIRADSPMGYQYAVFEIRTDANGGFEQYQWQSGGSVARLFRVNAGATIAKPIDFNAIASNYKTLIAMGDDVPKAMTDMLQRVHTELPWRMTYREFQIYVEGWVSGKQK